MDAHRHLAQRILELQYIHWGELKPTTTELTESVYTHTKQNQADAMVVFTQHPRTLFEDMDNCRHIPFCRHFLFVPYSTNKHCQMGHQRFSAFFEEDWTQAVRFSTFSRFSSDTSKHEERDCRVAQDSSSDVRIGFGERWPKWLEREFTDRKARSSNPTSASRLPLSRLGQPGSISALVQPSGGMAVRHRMGATAERLQDWVRATGVPLECAARLLACGRERLWLDCEITDGKARGSNPTSASQLLLSVFRQSGTTPALVLPCGGIAARHQKVSTADLLFLLVCPPSMVV
ncbi:hypothetical protein CSKR_105092 [Clonorchis sinensis]|uniref:Uncharacterized protein n=1 Tax=Clonorchis sinensis TaxID=79923 RepID=A0A3R7K0T5_CLOSI|nr:hypothetical protein CSKR_105092 [Clonorchis sinensis]